jgi:lipid-A-disaccharide synthase
MRIFLSAGEASGDALAAALVDELRKTGADLTFEGIGGRRFAAAIGDLTVDSTRWGVVSIVQSLQILPKAYWGSLIGRWKMGAGEPGIFVPIDFGFFNTRMCRLARKRGWKVMYFMPPSSWNRNKQRQEIPAITDAVVTPFPWSADMLKNMGANVYFFGHPVKQLIRDWREIAPANTDQRTIAILPGSRRAELDRHLPLVAQLVRGAPGRRRSYFRDGVMHDELSLPFEGLEAQLEFAVAPNLEVEDVRSRWNRLAPGRDDLFTQSDVYGVLARARAAVVCSGTATLEAALMRCPHVVVYMITKAMAREGKLIGFKVPKFIALPNIVLDRRLVPELAGLEIDPSAVHEELSALLRDGEKRENQLAGFYEIDALLGPDDAIAKTAELIAEMSR